MKIKIRLSKLRNCIENILKIDTTQMSVKDMKELLIKTITKKNTVEMKYPLEQNFVAKLRSDIYTKKVEVCGNLHMDRGILVETDYKEGQLEKKDGKERNMCYFTNKFATNYIYHTHPLISFSFPSFEDISTIIKSPQQKSFIFTIWGIWIIESTPYIKPRYMKEDEFKKETAKPCFYMRIGKDTQECKPFTDSIKYITEFITICQSLTRLSIQLISWEEYDTIKIKS